MKLKLVKANLFSNTVKVMLFIFDVQYYVALELCRRPESMYLLKMTRKLSPEHVKLRLNILWDNREQSGM